MAKALLGHVGLVPDMHLVAELRALRNRVSELEAELGCLRRENEALVSAVHVEDDLSALAQEPVFS